MRVVTTFRGALLALLAFSVSPWATAASAVCPTTKAPSKPRDPPPPAPQDPPPPPPKPGGPSPNGAPQLTPRDLPPTTSPGDALDAGTWEGWWDLNRWDFVPRVRRQTAEPGNDGGGDYAVTLPPALRPAVDLWIEALADDDGQVQQAAAGALAIAVTTYRHGDTLAALQKVRERGDAFAQDLAGLALARRKQESVAPALRRVLASRAEVHVSRAFAAFGLIALGDEEGLAEIARVSTDLAEPELAGALLLALGETRELRHLPTIMKAAERRTGAAARLRRVRADAIAALGKLGCRATVPYLAGLLDDREKVIARSAALALGGFPEPEAKKALREVGLVSEDEFVRGFSAVSLGRLGDGALMPSLGARVADEKEHDSVKGFALLGLGLLKAPIGVPLLRTPLSEEPRTPLFGAAALSAGLCRGSVYRDLLAPSVEDPRSTRVPMCGALALALIGEKPMQSAMRSRAWLDSAYLRPGFAEALALLDPEAQSSWLLDQLGKAKRSSGKKALTRALACCGGPKEAAALVDLWKTTPAGDTGLRTSIVNALVPMLTDHELSFARRLLMHTYYLQKNIVLAHLDALP